ncbi:hypothetical protein BOTBODRAFT_49708 [Botryobasidium botryosum FD-172 SS1]|uniref:Helicase C-terminal domain-containing protein n=1 Tax=Botryobasidium botryosum (strain FD-172 SS1) TaxID=930990 RepID=A0A067M2I5_BOTB1|nr:hypothetical protein BOTBODRAFT_49708 [Botryobasidium botryosum FD-172 SS1]
MVHTFYSALLNLRTPAYPDAPFCFGPWQDLTGCEPTGPRGLSTREKRDLQVLFTAHAANPRMIADKRVVGFSVWKSAITKMVNKAKMREGLFEIMASHGVTPGAAWSMDPEGLMPNRADFLGEFLKPAGQYLFGAEAFSRHPVSGTLIVKHDFRVALNEIHSMVWQSALRSLRGAIQAQEAERKAAESSWDGEADPKADEAEMRDAGGGGGTLVRAILANRKWLATRQVLFMDRSEELEERLQELETVFREEGLNAEYLKPPKKGGGKEKALIHLATRSEIRHAFAVYNQLFLQDKEGEVDMMEEVAGLALFDRQTGDLGVGDYREMKRDVILGRLGLRKERVPWFKEEHSLLWHQLVGELAFLERIFTPDQARDAGKILLCDDVGLGKTIQCIALVSMLAHIRTLQQEGRSLAAVPCVGRPLSSVRHTQADSSSLLSGGSAERRYFCGKEEAVPELPTLIVMTKSLLPQFLAELQKFLQLGAFDSFIYTGSPQEREEFWGAEGAWGMCNQVPGKRVVLVALTTLASEMKLLIDLFKKEATAAAHRGGPTDKYPIPDDMPPSIFHQKWLVCAMDEAHNVRNTDSLSFKAAFQVMSESRVKLAMTATPLYTKPAKFLIQYRMKLCHTDGLLTKVPETLDEYEANPSSKLGEQIPFVPPPDMVTHPRGRRRKILIYQAFSSFGEYFRRVLELHGITVVHIDGDTSMQDRQGIVESFQREDARPDGAQTDPCRILAVSAVGGEGLNLARADIVIFFDQPWSSCDEAQFIGRASRHGQTFPVIVYHVLGQGTTDVMMSRLAKDKDAMLRKFCSPSGGAIKPLSKADWGDEAPAGGRAASDDEGETLDNTAASSRVPTPEPSPVPERRSRRAETAQVPSAAGEYTALPIAGGTQGGGPGYMTAADLDKLVRPARRSKRGPPQPKPRELRAPTPEAAARRQPSRHGQAAERPEGGEPRSGDESDSGGVAGPLGDWVPGTVRSHASGVDQSLVQSMRAALAASKARLNGQDPPV